MEWRHQLVAQTTPPTDAVDEHCTDCGNTTQHEVHVELRTESPDPENAAFSREPYRVAMCCRCGNETSIRMNNA